MNKWTAVKQFWSSFGLNAYEQNTVPKNASMPYITYNVAVAGLNEPQILTASLWYKSTSWANISLKAEEIEDAIGGGMGVSYDGGRLWITKGAPFAQNMAEPSDDKVRRMVIQVNAEFQ